MDKIIAATHHFSLCRLDISSRNSLLAFLSLSLSNLWVNDDVRTSSLLQSDVVDIKRGQQIVTLFERNWLTSRLSVWLLTWSTKANRTLRKGFLLFFLVRQRENVAGFVVLSTEGRARWSCGASDMPPLCEKKNRIEKQQETERKASRI